MTWMLIPIAIGIFIGLAIPRLPIFDEWPVVGGQFVDAQNGFHPSSWLRPVNEHPIPVLRLILTLNGFGGDSQLRLMILSLIVAALAFITILRVSETKIKSAILCFFLAAGFFTFAQWESMFMGMVLHFYLYSLGVVLCALSLVRRSIGLSLLGIILCGGSLASWPLVAASLVAGIISLPLSFQIKLRWALSILTVSACLIVGIPSAGGSFTALATSFFSQPLQILAYTAVYLGGPFYMLTKDPWLCGAIGMLALAAITFLILKQQITSRAPLLFLWLHLLVVAFVTALARVQYGVAHGAASRYLALSLPAWIYLLVILINGSNQRLRRSAYVALGLLVLGSPRGLSWFLNRKLPERVQATSCYQTLKASRNWNRSDLDGCFAAVTHSAPEMREIAQRLDVDF